MNLVSFFRRNDPWVEDVLATLPPPAKAEPGRECPACLCPRTRHDSWGCQCGCRMDLAALTQTIYRRAS